MSEAVFLILQYMTSQKTKTDLLCFVYYNSGLCSIIDLEKEWQKNCFVFYCRGYFLEIFVKIKTVSFGVSFWCGIFIPTIQRVPQTNEFTPRSSVDKPTNDQIPRSWVRPPPKSKIFSLVLLLSPIRVTVNFHDNKDDRGSRTNSRSFFYFSVRCNRKKNWR